MTAGNGTEVVLGLRFDPKDLPRLTELVNDYETGQRRGDGMRAILKRAATATAIGDPLRLHTSNVEEAHAWAEGMGLYGLQVPGIEQVRI